MENNNQPRNLYERLDDTIMKGVNAGVRAWNWTTGRTKTDLALSLMYGGPGISSLSFGISQSSSNNPIPAVVGAIIVGPVIAGVNWLLWGAEMKKMGEIEERAAEKNILSLEVEKYKSRCAFNGPAYLGVGSVIQYSNEGNAPSLPHAVLFGSMGASFYVMRADYLPPRKNCVQRGIEKLSEKLKNIELPTIPNPLPQPIPIGVNNQVI